MVEVIHCSEEHPVPPNFGSRLADRLADLQHCEEPEDPSLSAQATSACFRVLAAAAVSLESSLPLTFPMISVTEKGGILCEWRGKNWSLCAWFAPNGVLALHDMRLRAGRVVAHTTTPDACADDLELAWRRRSSVDS